MDWDLLLALPRVLLHPPSEHIWCGQFWPSGMGSIVILSVNIYLLFPPPISMLRFVGSVKKRPTFFCEAAANDV